MHQPDHMTSNKEQTSGGRTNTGVIDTFMNSVLKGGMPGTDGKEALKAMRVNFTAERSAWEGRAVPAAHD